MCVCVGGGGGEVRMDIGRCGTCSQVMCSTIHCVVSCGYVSHDCMDLYIDCAALSYMRMLQA